MGMGLPAAIPPDQYDDVGADDGEVIRGVDAAVTGGSGDDDGTVGLNCPLMPMPL